MKKRTLCTLSALRDSIPDLTDMDCNALFEYPHILVQLDKLWGQPECGSFLISLLEDKRGTRKGFHGTYMKALLKIAHCHIALMAEQQASSEAAQIASQEEQKIDVMTKQDLLNTIQKKQ